MPRHEFWNFCGKIAYGHRVKHLMFKPFVKYEKKLLSVFDKRVTWYGILFLANFTSKKTRVMIYSRNFCNITSKHAWSSQIKWISVISIVISFRFIYACTLILPGCSTSSKNSHQSQSIQSCSTAGSETGSSHRSSIRSITSFMRWYRTPTDQEYFVTESYMIDIPEWQWVSILKMI